MRLLALIHELSTVLIEVRMKRWKTRIATVMVVLLVVIVMLTG